MSIKEQLIHLRNINGLSQEDLAEKLNVTRQSVSKWEVGETMPDTDKLIKISEIFNVSTDYLLKGIDLSLIHILIVHRFRFFCL